MMHKKYNDAKTLSIFSMELFILFFILAGAAIQVVLGKEHILFQLLRTFYVPAMVFFAGLYTYYNRKNPSAMLIKAGVYSGLFLFFGLCNQVLLNHKTPFRSLVRLLTLEKLPTPSEMFFTTAVLFFCCFLFAKHIDLIFHRKRLFLILSVFLILMVYFPENIFGYPLIGVFTGCETYDCIPLLPYFGYFIAGILIAGFPKKFDKKLILSGAVLSLCSGMLLFTFLKPVACVLIPVLPVYLFYLFVQYCPLCYHLAEFVIKIIDLLFEKFKKWYRDFFDNKKSALPLYFAVYTFMFCIMAVCVFISFFEYDNSIAWMHDAISQYIPRIHYFTNYIQECISHLFNGNLNFPSYTFRAGLGNSVPLSYEPVYWLFALFDSSNVELAYNIVTVLRFLLAGLSASVFFLYYKRGYFESLIGSMIYTFCGFAIYAGVLHAHFIGPMIFLPLLILATEEVFRKKRWYLCTVFVALALPANYYFIYMSTIAMGIYYVARFIFTKDKTKKNWKYFFTTTCTFAGAYLLGVVIGNISLFTSFSSYVSSGRSGSSQMTAMSYFFYNNSWLVKCFTYFISSPGSPGLWLKLGFVPLSYIAIVILFMKKDKKLLKFLFAVGAAFCIFPIAAYVLGGFSTITNRWCYIFALLVSYITVFAIPELRTLTRRELKILLVSLLPYMIIILMNRDYRTEYTLCSLAILLGTYVLILCMNHEIHLINIHTARITLVILCCGALTLNAYYQYLGGNNTSKDSFAKTSHVLDEITDTPMKVLADYPDDSFYRVSTAEIPRKNLCSSLVLNYNSIATFSSTISGTVMDYNCELGNTAWNLVQLGGFDNRTLMNALACVKYYALTKKETPRLPYGYEKTDTVEEGGKTINIYKNNYALPLGYTYDSVISEEDLKQYNAAQKQEIMLQSAVTEDTQKSGISENTSPSLTATEVQIKDYEASGLKIKDGSIDVLEEGATLTLSFDGLEDSETYLIFDGYCNPKKGNGANVVSMDFVCGNYKRSFDFRSINHTYNTGQESYLFNLGYRKDAANSCTITFKTKGSFTCDSFKVYCQPMGNYSSYIENLTENKLEDVKIESNVITGNISLTKEKMLVLSIPYQKGWTAYVDGKEVDIQKTNLMYMGLSLEPGEHEIRLQFERPGISASLCLSAIGIVIFIIALIIRRKRIKMSK
ncbi:MAG: YfhO family protein [Lachnospiraceae bacterium]